MPPRKGRHDSSFDTGTPCPKCGAVLIGLARLKEIPFGAMMLPPRLKCEACNGAWELASKEDPGALRIGNFYFVPVDTGELN